MTLNADGIQIIGQKLPADFADQLRAMREAGDPRLSATLWLARQWGWGLTALGDALGVTREAIRQRIDVKPFDQYPTSELPSIPPPPRRPTPMPKPPRYRRLLIKPEVADRLREMHAVAKTVTGGTPVDSPKRRISEELSALMADLVEQGISAGQIADVLGVWDGAVFHRLGRHGYGKVAPSQERNVYRNVQVEQLQARSHCKRGHEMRRLPCGQNYCPACTSLRYQRRKAAKNSPERPALAEAAG